jgi:hypothetical protein
MGSPFSEKLKSGEIKPPAAETIGFRMVSFGDGESRFELENTGLPIPAFPVRRRRSACA